MKTFNVTLQTLQIEKELFNKDIGVKKRYNMDIPISAFHQD